MKFWVEFDRCREDLPEIWTASDLASQYDWQEFVVGDVLNLGNDGPARFVE